MTATKFATRPARARKASLKAAPTARAGRGAIETRKIAGLKDADIITTTHATGSRHVLYVRSKGIDDFVTNVHAADPLKLIETERKGVAGAFVKDLSKRMEISA